MSRIYGGWLGQYHEWKKSWFKEIYTKDTHTYQADQGPVAGHPTLLDVLLALISGVEKKTDIYHHPIF